MKRFMVGWVLQPDVNRQVFAPIMGVSGNTVSVRGDYAALGQAGTSFRTPRASPLDCPCGSWPAATAPPGIERRGAHAGTLSRWVAAESSRCLYASYRYESPLAGFEAGTSTHPQADCRQTGSNFGGLHYTLFRHYDPVQMRFTGPDPAASPFHNLHAYCGNNPAAFCDPDGLAPVDGHGKRAIWDEGRWRSAEKDPTKVEACPPKLGTWRDFWFGASYEAREILTGKYSAWGMVTGKGIYGHYVSEEEFAADYAVDPNTVAFQGGRVAVVVAVEVTAAIASGGLSTARLAPTALRTTTTLARVEQRIATVGRIETQLATVNARLAQRLNAWKAYVANGGTKNMAQWVKSTQRQPWGTGFQSGYSKWFRSVNSTNGNAALSGKQAYLYRLFHKDGTFLKWGVTQNLGARYSKKFMGNKDIQEFARGTRREMLKLERQLVRDRPGPLNREPWAGR